MRRLNIKLLNIKFNGTTGVTPEQAHLGWLYALGRVCCCLLLSLSLWATGWLGFASSPARAIDYKQENLTNADFAGKDLRDANFTKANLYHSNLSHANLVGVRFFAANLEGANLEGADLQLTVLDQARFTEANLTNANLTGAYAFSAQFKGAIINGADFTDAEMRPDTQKLLCEVATGKNPITGHDTRTSLACD
jgi:Pentapeptide repeats (8 copies)